MPRHWIFETQQLFGYIVAKVKATVFELQFSTLESWCPKFHGFLTFSTPNYQSL